MLSSRCLYVRGEAYDLNVLRTLSLSLLSRWVDVANLEELPFVSCYGYVLGSVGKAAAQDIGLSE